MSKTEVWRNDANGKLYHDLCFEQGESRDGFTPVKRDELTDEDTCDSCDGVFLIGIVETGHVSEDDEDDDDTEDEC